MRYIITTPIQINDWQQLRTDVFGDAVPVFEQFGGGAPYLVEFSEPVTPADLGPLFKVELISNP